MDDVPVYVRQWEAADLTIHRPQHVYESQSSCPIFSDDREGMVICQLTSNVNESGVWCEICGEDGVWTRLSKSYQSQGVRIMTVWQDTDTPNLTTGRVETDARKMQQYLDMRSDIEGERLNMKVDFQIVDPTDRDALGVTDEGMDATHDRAVSDGRKDSRGRFVW